ncbi:hypothetical protein [Sphingobacterium suaedae]|uniref:Uncharacterized protein n=1 Tax=Sphingobacterium suaedae TaxID=1686402 RepID=A0ABW5KMK1_9SPHI
MNPNFEELKELWRTVDSVPKDSLKKTEERILHMRKRRRTGILYWSVTILLFSGAVIGYILYTDELQGINKSVAECMLLFNAVYLFVFSWKKINDQRKELLLNSVEFLTYLSRVLVRRRRRDIRVGCITISIFLITPILYYVDEFALSPITLVITGVILIVELFVLWFLLKPLYEERKLAQSQELSIQITELIHEIHDEKN